MRASPTAVPDPSDRLIGREILGQYVITSRLGEGGMGTVYLADQPAFGRTAVIKVLSAAGATSRDAARRFVIEARAASRLNHPNIVTVYNAGELDDGTLYLAMEHVDGPSLQQVIRSEAPLSPARAVGVAAQIATALAEAHRRGVVHRDLKPSNVMLVRRAGDSELVKVLDFGVAKLEGVELTHTGRVCGTPVYMSPEQFGGSAVDGRADLYALGVVLFEMLVGAPPFTSETAMGYMAKHLTEAPRIPPSVPAPLAAVLLGALAKDPADRPASLEVFRDALVGALASPSAEAPTLELATAPARALVIATAAPETRVVAARAQDAPIAIASARARPVGERLRAAAVAAAAWFVAVARAAWASSGARLFRPRPKTLGERFTGLLETVGLRRRRTWRERLRDRVAALAARLRRGR